MNILQSVAGTKGLVIAGGVVLVMVLIPTIALMICHLKSENKSERINTLLAEKELIIQANKDTNLSLDECKIVNEMNTRERFAAEDRARLAAERASKLEQELEEKANETFTTNDEELAVCRRMDEPLPHDFLDWLCITGAENCS